MTQEEKKDLKKKLRHGDVSKIANLCGLTPKAVCFWLSDSTKHSYAIEKVAKEIVRRNERSLEEVIKELNK